MRRPGCSTAQRQVGASGLAPSRFARFRRGRGAPLLSDDARHITQFPTVNNGQILAVCAEIAKSGDWVAERSGFEPSRPFVFAGSTRLHKHLLSPERTFDS